ncbi:hypothetical protein [Bacteroides sp. 51]|uniref:hypothetical protein n=1 Tax=Bacteroides sp. 51 TaxID=2302938 RepID=UPI0013D691D4|nr:hypothetical protein [Bacteroides sp. 51]NDV81348.1 hypothetical protein [Bacteroides sp. 51]
MIKNKTKHFTEVSVSGGCLVRICNRTKGNLVFSGNPQLQIEDEDGFEQYVNLSNEQIDEIIEALQLAKQLVE